MRTSLLTFALLVIVCVLRAQQPQFSLGTDNPNPESILEIQSTNKGILIPRMTTTQRNSNLGSLVATDRGMLIYNITDNEFNYWDGGAWVSFPSTVTLEWTDGGTFLYPADGANEDVTIGAVITGDGRLNVTSSKDKGINSTLATSGATDKVGIYNAISGPGTGMHYGLLNQIGSPNASVQNGLTNNFLSAVGSASATKYGVKNYFQQNSSGAQYGMFSNFENSGNGIAYGLYNRFLVPGTGTKYGLYNDFGSGIANVGGTLFGIFTKFATSITSTSNKFGSYVKIPASIPGNHYGYYADVLNSNGYAGYFLGNVAIGTTTANEYILPASRGTLDQIMQTDGSGNVTWVDPSTISSDDPDWFVESTTNAPTAITDDIYHTGNVAIGKNSANYQLDVEESGSSFIGSQINYTGSGVGPVSLLVLESGSGSGTHTGIYNLSSGSHNSNIDGILSSITNTGSGTHWGYYASLISGSGAKYGLEEILIGSGANTGIKSTINGPSGTAVQIGLTNSILTTTAGITYGVLSDLSGNGTGIKYGTRNNISNGSGIHYGTFNDLSSTGSSSNYGTYSELFGSSSGAHYGHYSSISAAGTGLRYGSFNTVYGTGTGSHYGTANNLSGTGSGSKYGSYNVISTSSNGAQYAVYGSALKAAASTWAGYFLGDVYIGTSTFNGYELPPSRGTLNQVMQTDGVGNVSWVNPSSLNISEWTDAGSYLTPADGTAEGVKIGANNSIGKLTVDNGTYNRGISIFYDGITTSWDRALDIDATITNGGGGIMNKVSGSASSSGGVPLFGLYNDFSGAASSGSSLYGVNNIFSGSGSSPIYGMLNTFNGTQTSGLYGMNNSFTTNSNTSNFSLYSVFSGSGSGPRYGTYTYTTTTGAGNKFGNYNSFSSGAGGAIYGIYNTIECTSPYSKYGVYNIIGSGAGGQCLGVYNYIASTNTLNKYGELTTISNGSSSGEIYGNYVAINNSGSGIKYGYYLLLGTGGTGARYGFYANSSTSTNYWAAYLIGRSYVSYRLGIGITAPAYQLQLSSNSAAKPTSNAWLVASDDRLKKDVHPFEDGLNLIKKIKPIWFTYNGKGGMPDDTGIGTIAQEFKKIAPYMVSDWEYTDSTTSKTENYLAIDYGPLQFVIVNAIQEQQLMIEENAKVKAENVELRNEMKALKERIVAIEARLK